MSDNDLIKRGEVRREIMEFISHNKTLVDEWAANCIDDIIDGILPAAQEMTAREYLTQEARMCHHYGLPSTFEVSGWTVDEAIEMVKKFAREHPEERSDK